MTADHGSRLDRHEMEIRELRDGQVAILKKLDHQDGALSAIATAITEMRAQKGPPWHQLISTASQVVLVLGAIISAVVYVSSNGQSPAQHALELRMARAEWRGERVEERLVRVEASREREAERLSRLEFAAGWKPVTRTD